MEASPSERPKHAELAARIPAPPPDSENEPIQMAKKTFHATLWLVVGFVAAAVVYTTLL